MPRVADEEYKGRWPPCPEIQVGRGLEGGCDHRQASGKQLLKWWPHNPKSGHIKGGRSWKTGIVFYRKKKRNKWRDIIICIISIFRELFESSILYPINLSFKYEGKIGHFKQRSTLLLFFTYLFIYLASPGLSCGMRTLSCGMRDLVPWPGIKPGPPALEAQDRNHWTTREVPKTL